MDSNWLTIKEEGQNAILVKCSKEAHGKIIIPEGVSCIGDGAFMSCNNITHIVIPDSVKKIGVAPFFGCKLLKYAEIPEVFENNIPRIFAGCLNGLNILIT